MPGFATYYLSLAPFEVAVRYLRAIGFLFDSQLLFTGGGKLCSTESKSLAWWRREAEFPRD